MKITISSPSNQTIGSAISHVIGLLNDKLKNCDKVIQDALLWTTRNHVKQRYPNSNHWNPNKINKSSDSKSIDVDIAGASRNYHNLTITPKRKSALTIPISTYSKGKSAADFPDIFKPSGKDYLAVIMNENITPLFLLRKKVFQKQDKTLLPTDETYLQNIYSRLEVYLNN